MVLFVVFFFFSSRRRHTRCLSDWSSDVCSSDLRAGPLAGNRASRFSPTSCHEVPSQERENFALAPSTSSLPPTKTYGLRIFQTRTPVFPASATSPPPFVRTFCTVSAPRRQDSPVKSG